jgi:peroxiredoxin
MEQYCQKIYSGKGKYMKKYAILLIGLSVIALGGLKLSLTGCSMQQLFGDGDPYPENAPDVAADVVYGYKLIHVGDSFPDTTLKAPDSPQDRSYLGLKSDAAFSIKDIAADMVLVAVLNIHCMPCQAEAIVFDDLLEQIEADVSSQNQIRIIGVGTGNTEAEVIAFREQYGIRFPIVPDPQFELHKVIGEPTTPFSVLVRLESKPDTAIVAVTYEEAIDDSDDLYQDMMALMTLDLTVFQEKGLKNGEKHTTIKPLFSESEIAAQVKNAMAEVSGDNGDIKQFRKIPLEGHHLYSGISQGHLETKRLFAEVVSSPTLCDVCHDIHFFYIFNEKGAVVDFVPLQVTKWGNEEWSEEDIRLMRERLIGRFIFTPFYFNPHLDAVTSATITSAVIFNKLSRGKELFDLLKQEGLIS